MTYQWSTRFFFLFFLDSEWYLTNISTKHQPRCKPPYQLLHQTLYLPNSTYGAHDLIFLQEKFWWQSRIGSRSLRNDCEMFIIFCSVTAQTEKIIPWDYSGTKKRSKLAQNNLFQRKFFFLLDMMHPIIPSANVKQQRYSASNNTGNIVSKTGEVLLSIVTLTHSLTHSISHFRDIVASPPKGMHSSHKKRKISAQPNTI